MSTAKNVFFNGNFRNILLVLKHSISINNYSDDIKRETLGISTLTRGTIKTFKHREYYDVTNWT